MSVKKATPKVKPVAKPAITKQLKKVSAKNSKGATKLNLKPLAIPKVLQSKNTAENQGPIDLLFGVNGQFLLDKFLGNTQEYFAQLESDSQDDFEFSYCCLGEIFEIQIIILEHLKIKLDLDLLKKWSDSYQEMKSKTIEATGRQWLANSVRQFMNALYLWRHKSKDGLIWHTYADAKEKKATGYALMGLNLDAYTTAKIEEVGRMGGKNKNKLLKDYLESILPNYAGQHIDMVLRNIYMAVQGYAKESSDKENKIKPLSEKIYRQKDQVTYGMKTLEDWIKLSPNNGIKFD